MLFIVQDNQFKPDNFYSLKSKPAFLWLLSWILRSTCIQDSDTFLMTLYTHDPESLYSLLRPLTLFSPPFRTWVASLAAFSFPPALFLLSFEDHQLAVWITLAILPWFEKKIWEMVLTFWFSLYLATERIVRKSSLAHIFVCEIWHWGHTLDTSPKMFYNTFFFWFIGTSVVSRWDE